MIMGVKEAIVITNIVKLRKSVSHTYINIKNVFNFSFAILRASSTYITQGNISASQLSWTAEVPQTPPTHSDLPSATVLTVLSLRSCPITTTSLPWRYISSCRNVTMKPSHVTMKTSHGLFWGNCHVLFWGNCHVLFWSKSRVVSSHTPITILFGSLLKQMLSYNPQDQDHIELIVH